MAFSYAEYLRRLGSGRYSAPQESDGSAVDLALPEDRWEQLAQRERLMEVQNRAEENNFRPGDSPAIDSFIARFGSTPQTWLGPNAGQWNTNEPGWARYNGYRFSEGLPPGLQGVGWEGSTFDPSRVFQDPETGLYVWESANLRPDLIAAQQDRESRGFNRTLISGLAAVVGGGLLNNYLLGGNAFAAPGADIGLELGIGASPAEFGGYTGGIAPEEALVGGLGNSATTPWGMLAPGMENSALLDSWLINQGPLGAQIAATGITNLASSGGWSRIGSWILDNPLAAARLGLTAYGLANDFRGGGGNGNKPGGDGASNPVPMQINRGEYTPNPYTDRQIQDFRYATPPAGFNGSPGGNFGGGAATGIKGGSGLSGGYDVSTGGSSGSQSPFYRGQSSFGAAPSPFPKGESTRYEGPPEWYQNYGRGFLDLARDVAATPYAPYSYQRVADMSPMQRWAVEGIGGLAGGTPYTDAAGGMLTETLMGGGMNPYMGGVANRVVNDATRGYFDATGQVMDRFNTAGNWGGSAQMQALDRRNEAFARGLTDGLAPIYQSGYENERGRQMQAAGMVPSLYGAMGSGYQNALNAGGFEQMQMQRLLDSRFDDFNEWRNYPQQQLGILGNAFRGLGGGAGTVSTTNTPDPSRSSQALGWLSLLSSFGK